MSQIAGCVRSKMSWLTSEMMKEQIYIHTHIAGQDTALNVFICLCDLWKARALCENYQNPGYKNTKYSQFSKSGRFPGKAGLPRRIVAPRSLESRRSLCHRPRRPAERSKFNQTTILTFVREEKLRKSISRQKTAR